MELRPIVSTLRRHKTASLLIVLEIALSCAIICNAVFLVATRLERMDRPTGMAENELVVIRSSSVSGGGGSLEADKRADTAVVADINALRALPGVTDAASVNQIVFGDSAWNSSIMLAPKQLRATVNAAMFLGDSHAVDTLGLRVVEGRKFNPDEFVAMSDVQKPASTTKIPSIIITRSVADKLFPNESALGKKLYIFGDDPLVVVGVVEAMLRPNDNGGPDASQYSMLLPVTVGNGFYVMRTDPARRAEVLKAGVAALEQVNRNRIITDQKLFTEMRDKFYAKDRSMAWLLITVCIALLVVTALGIVGLASFWVQQRTKQIGIRRALGATRGQILRYFQTENLILATGGIVLGMLLAYAINQLLMAKYELPRLPLMYLPIGAVTLWLLGQVAVFWPARKAASVSPAVATRSV